MGCFYYWPSFLCFVTPVYQDAVKIMAKDLIRTRRYVKKFMLMRANIQAVSLKLTALKSTDAMAQAMKGVTKAMATMNRQVCIIINYINITYDRGHFPPFWIVYVM